MEKTEFERLSQISVEVQQNRVMNSYQLDKEGRRNPSRDDVKKNIKAGHICSCIYCTDGRDKVIGHLSTDFYFQKFLLTTESHSKSFITFLLPSQYAFLPIISPKQLCSNSSLSKFTTSFQSGNIRGVPCLVYFCMFYFGH